MPAIRRSALFFVVLALLLTTRSLGASTLSYFQARLAQTTWNLQQTGAILGSLPHAAGPVSTPDGLESYFALLSENVAALTRFSAGSLTDEQRRIVAEGLKGIAAGLKDQGALAANRGLTSFVLALGTLETNCRAAITGIP